MDGLLLLSTLEKVKMVNTSNNKKIASNTILLTFRMLVVMIIGLYSTRVILDVLGVSDYGIYNVVGGFVSMFAFINTSMSNGIQRFYNFEYGSNGGGPLSHVFNTALHIQVVITIIIFVLTETVGLWYLYEKMVIPEERFLAAFFCFQFSVVSLLLSVLQLPFAALVMAHESMDFYALLSILDAILKLSIVIALPFLEGDHLIDYGFLYMLISLVNILLYIYYVRKHYPEDVRRGKGDILLYKKMLSFSGWNLFGSLGIVLRDQGMNMILNVFYGTVVNAARGVAFQVMGACKSFTENITTAARPQMTQSYAEGNVLRSISIMNSMSKMCFIVFYILSLPIIIEIDFILSVWLNNNIPNYTNIFLTIVVAETMIDVFNPPVSFLVHATGKMKNYQLVRAIISFVSLPFAYYLLFLGYEPYYVFIVAFVFSIIKQIVSIIILRSLISFSIILYLKDVIIPMFLVAVSSFILPLLIHIFMPYGWARLLGVVIISFLCVIVSSLLLGLNKSERKMVSGMVLSRFSYVMMSKNKEHRQS